MAIYYFGVLGVKLGCVKSLFFIAKDMVYGDTSPSNEREGEFMKKLLLVSSLVVVLAFAFGCKAKSQTGISGGNSSSPAAVVDGVAITMQELDEAAKNQLQKVETQIYQIKKRTLDDMIETKLIEAAAKKKGLGTEKYLAEEVDAKVAAPTEDEIKALYDARKGDIKQSFDEVKGQIKGYLEQNRKAKAKQDLIARLNEGADIQIKLEPPRVTIDLEGAPILGEKGAKVTLVEFSDYQCPFCKRVRPTIWRLMDEYKGKLGYAFFDFPLSFHRDAKKAHEAARCAGDQGKYFEYNRKVFDNQGSIGVDDLKNYAKQLNLNTGDFGKCLDSGKHAAEVEAAIEKGMNAGVSGTPAFFINGIMLSGAQPYESFKEIIEEELKR